MEKDILEPYGYKNIKNLTIVKRHNSLNKVIQDIKPLSIYRRLIAIATLNKNKNIELFKILREDAEYIKKYHPKYYIVDRDMIMNINLAIDLRLCEI